MGWDSSDALLGRRQSSHHATAQASDDGGPLKAAVNGGGAQHHQALAEAGAPKQAPRGGNPLARVWWPAAELAAAMRPLLSPGLRAMTLLLMGIWFVNALCYYGLVLLTTTVRGPVCPPGPNPCSARVDPCSTDGWDEPLLECLSPHADAQCIQQKRPVVTIITIISMLECGWLP